MLIVRLFSTEQVNTVRLQNTMALLKKLKDQEGRYA